MLNSEIIISRKGGAFNQSATAIISTSGDVDIDLQNGDRYHSVLEPEALVKLDKAINGLFFPKNKKLEETFSGFDAIEYRIEYFGESVVVNQEFSNIHERHFFEIVDPEFITAFTKN